MIQSDPELHEHIMESGIPPFFALSWFITWFAHNVPDLADISRIFDALIASHPLMPLYLSAAVMQVHHLPMTGSSYHIVAWEMSWLGQARKHCDKT